MPGCDRSWRLQRPGSTESLSLGALMKKHFFVVITSALRAALSTPVHGALPVCFITAFVDSRCVFAFSPDVQALAAQYARERETNATTHGADESALSGRWIPILTYAIADQGLGSTQRNALREILFSISSRQGPQTDAESAALAGASDSSSPWESLKWQCWVVDSRLRQGDAWKSPERQKELLDYIDAAIGNAAAPLADRVSQLDDRLGVWSAVGLMRNGIAIAKRTTGKANAAQRAERLADFLDSLPGRVAGGAGTSEDAALLPPDEVLQWSASFWAASGNVPESIRATDRIDTLRNAKRGSAAHAQIVVSGLKGQNREDYVAAWIDRRGTWDAACARIIEDHASRTVGEGDLAIAAKALARVQRLNSEFPATIPQADKDYRALVTSTNPQAYVPFRPIGGNLVYAEAVLARQLGQSNASKLAALRLLTEFPEHKGRSEAQEIIDRTP